MKKISFVLCALAMGISAAHAEGPVTDGKVTFNGKLIAETCQVTDASKDIKVELPTVSTTKLAASGDETGSTSFPIEVTNCPAAITKVGAHFEANGSTGYNPATGNLVNAAPASPTPASNVEVRLYDFDGSTVIPVGQSGSKVNVDATTKGAKLSYAGGYYATGKTSVGPVYAQVQYVLDYN